jgi:hypothetical protein
MRPNYLIGLDLGRARDYTALCVAERREVGTGIKEPAPNTPRSDDDPRPILRERMVGSYDVTHLERLPLGTPYTAVPDRLQLLIQGLTAVHQQRETASPGQYGRLVETTLIVDQTGVGVAVVDVLRAAGLTPVAVTIHGGDATTPVSSDEYRVPKRELAGVIQVLLQGRRLRIAEGLPQTAALTEELRNFKAKISLSGHDSYGAGADWREGNHDDLVLAVALACWYGESRPRPSHTYVSSYLDGPADDRSFPGLQTF